MAELRDLSEIIQEKLRQPVKNREGRTLLNEDGSMMTTMEAIAMTVVQNAMKWDMSSVMLVRNLTRSTQKEGDDRAEYERRKAHYVEQISAELKAKGLWYEQMLDIETVASTMCFADRIKEAMLAPDYDDIVTETRRDGSQTVRLNPLHERLDELQKQVRNGLDRLYADAQKRKQLKTLRSGSDFLASNI